MSDSRFDPRFDPAFQRGWDGPEPATTTAPEPARVASPDRIVVTAEPEPDFEPDARRLNPFLLALAAVAVALVVAGLGMASAVSSGFNAQGPTSQVDWAILQVLMIASPVTALLGVATGIGVLFVFAVRWRREPRD
ncbi:hypothetical protein [Schumannella luteola]